jgi:hypothetical protein
MKRAVLTIAVVVAMLFTFGCKSSDTGSAMRAAPEAAWNVPADDIAFNNMRMEDALSHLQSLTPNGKMDVRWESLEAVGLERDTLVNLQLESGMPVAKVLDVLMRQFRQLDPFNPPASRLIDGVMVVGSKEAVGA